MMNKGSLSRTARQTLLEVCPVKFQVSLNEEVDVLRVALTSVELEVVLS